MTISELIEQLEIFKKQYGNLNVIFHEEVEPLDSVDLILISDMRDGIFVTLR